MVSKASVQKQLKKVGFKVNGWGRGEAAELQSILVPGEEIYECVNGIYEGGFALLVATDVRVLLIDKKPLNFLTVEDLRFDMINEMDYSHRLTGARISISTGSKNMKFHSYNQPRLRKLITHVQRCMAEAKKQQSSHQEEQNQHLEQINKQLQTYLLAQYQYQQQLQQVQPTNQVGGAAPTAPKPVRPEPQLSDYLFAQSLLAQYEQSKPSAAAQSQPALAIPANDLSAVSRTEMGLPTKSLLNEIYADGLQEVFGSQQLSSIGAITINPLIVACAKLPLLLRLRRFGMEAATAAIR